MPCKAYIKKTDNSVPDESANWYRGAILDFVDENPRLSPLAKTQPGAGLVCVFHITDRTKEEMKDYTAAWAKAVSMRVTAGPDPDGRRRIEIRNNSVSVTGKNAWTQENMDNILSTWNAEYPSSNLVEGPNGVTDEILDVVGTFESGQYDEFEQVIINAGLGDVYLRTRWRVTEAGMLDMEANGDEQTDTAQVFINRCEDGYST